MKEFRSAPALGKGAGSYEEWWARYGTLKGFVKDAHSLYLESLGELGIVGFVFIAGAFLIGLVAGLRRVLARAGEERLALAAVWAAFLASRLPPGVDWMWEMTVVSVVGIALLGLLVSRASGGTDASEKPLRLRWDVAGRVALVVAGVCVILAAALPLLTNREIQASQAAVRAGDLGAAFKRADNARKIEPWATSPYQQLALVSEQAQEYGDAQYWARKAIEHAPNDWQPWFLPHVLPRREWAGHRGRDHAAAHPGAEPALGAAREGEARAVTERGEFCASRGCRSPAPCSQAWSDRPS